MRKLLFWTLFVLLSAVAIASYFVHFVWIERGNVPTVLVFDGRLVFFRPDQPGMWLMLDKDLTLGARLFAPSSADFDALCRFAHSWGFGSTFTILLWPVWLVPVVMVAARIIWRFIRFPDRRHPVCDSCGYDLRGRTGERCPECGEMII